jgi:general secretion pathway protein J
MHTPSTRQAGFTLIEVLVAITVMALMSLMAWRGLDGMLRSQNGLQSRADEVRTLQAGLAQWQTDLDHMVELSDTPTWLWDGKVLRLTRRANARLEAIQVVAWTWRNNVERPGGGDWQRWQSPPLTGKTSWRQAWAQAEQWSQTPTEDTQTGQVSVMALSGWQIFVHRGGSWANPLSSDVVTVGNTNAPSTKPGTPPDGVRLVLSLPQGPAGVGPLTLDWVRPTLSGGAP